MKHRLGQRICKDAVIERLEPDGDGAERIRITTNVVDREGDVIEADAWKLENYLRNPIVLWAHDSRGYTPTGGVPIGSTLAVEQDAAGLIARFKFRSPANDNDFVNVVQSAWEQGVLRAASVGFIPVAYEPLTASADEWYGPFRITEAELLEWSIVPIPANQEALRLAYESVLRSAGIPASVFTPHQPLVPERTNTNTELDAALERLERQIKNIKTILQRTS